MSVTVVIPTYNRAKLVPEAIDSVLGQTLAPIQVLVIDDGSTDGTDKALLKYGASITYHRQSNRGVSVARNVGLSMATGTYVAFLDSDDLWHPYKLELQTALLDRLPDVHLLFTEFEIHARDGSRLSNGSRRWLPDGRTFADFYDRTITCGDLGKSFVAVSPEVSIHLGRVYRQMLHEHFGLTSTAMLRRGPSTNEIRFPENVSLYEDREFFARVAQQHTVAFLDFETTINRGHEGVERLTLEPRLVKARSYLGLVQRVWKADPTFVAGHADEVRRAESQALLAVAREAVLASDSGVARDALESWRGLGNGRNGRGTGDARLLQICAAIPGGSRLLRMILRFTTALDVLRGRQSTRYSVNPTDRQDRRRT